MKQRSLDEAYVQWVIREYTYWTLLLHDDQRYLGRAYCWLVREGQMQRFSEITKEEQDELRTILREYEAALSALWKPDFMNYAWLANLFHEHGGHGHLHLIPRYKDARNVNGIEFVDGRWGKNFSPSEEFKPSKEVLVGIRDQLKGAISGAVS
jgi:diadenosine tetraphosphate (Ap4A) HIT family hydrolase